MDVLFQALNKAAAENPPIPAWAAEPDNSQC